MTANQLRTGAEAAVRQIEACRSDSSDGGMVRRARSRERGFTLIELVVAVCIVGILTAIAYPSYLNSVTKSRRGAAAACLSSFATHMERFYTANMRYDVDTAGDDIELPDLDCASDQQTGEFYNYDFADDQPTRTTYTLRAVPKGIQSTRDTSCGTLTVNQAGIRGAGGDVDRCW